MTEERKAGYLEALAHQGVEPVIIAGRPSQEFGRGAARAMQRDHPDVDTAVCFNDLVAMGMLSGFHEGGWQVGTDFLIADFDDIKYAAHTYLGLTSVHCNIAGIGAAAARTVLEWVEGGTAPPPETRMSVTLSVRQSSGVADSGGGLKLRN